MSQKTSRRTIARIVASQLVEPGVDKSKVMKSLAAYLVADGLVDDADMVMNDIADVLFELTGHLSVEVTSAHELTDEARANLSAYLQKSTDASTIDMHETVDPEVVGGFVVSTANAELDASVRSKLRQLTALA